MKFLKLPQEIQKVLLKHHIGEGITGDHLKKFEESGIMGFFTWSGTPEGHTFWSRVDQDLDHFYTVYPRPELIKPEYESLYKKTFKQNKITEETLDRDKVRELGLEHILIPQNNE